MLARTISLYTGLTLAGLGLGCANKLSPIPAQNVPPEIRLEPAGPAATGADGFAHVLRWSAFDSDGRVDHFLVAENPKSVDAIDDTWQRTTDRSFVVRMRTAAIMASREASSRRDPTIVAVRAVDDRGASSPPALRAFFAENVAPTVTITSPRPIRLSEYIFPPTIRVRWVGSDPESPNMRPVQYKFKLFDDVNLIDQILLNPDLIRQLFAPTFTGWDSVPAESTATTLRGLDPGRHYMFAITALDDSGGYDPVFRFDKNVLRFAVGFGVALGPRITLYNEFFNFQVITPSITPDPNAGPDVACPPRVPITFRWIAQTIPGAEPASYRWVLDPSSLEDARTRPDESRDFDRWSRWSPTTLSATVGPFHGTAADREHRLYVQAADLFGDYSTAVIRFHIVQQRFERELLIVDDTRLKPDLFGPNGDLLTPTGRWPGAAELDSFLFARGGFPWRAYQPGTMSTPGLFNGYDYDTLGTRNGQLDPTVPLEVLLRYRQVVWVTDAVGALNSAPGTDPLNPITALRSMSAPGRASSLGAYVERGGRLWLVGGGAGLASLKPFDRTDNNASDLTRFSNARGELVPGRFMYDLAHWRTELDALTTPFAVITRSPFPIGEYHGAPAYSMLPASIDPRTPESDPLPPLRGIVDFYVNPSLGIEALVGPNAILEPSPHPGLGIPPLDTLFVVRNSRLPSPGPNPAVDRIVNPVMTYYHGRENGSVVFTGFDLWSYQRQREAMLVDAVLQGIWGLSKGGVPSEHAPPDGGAAVVRRGGASSR